MLKKKSKQTIQTFSDGVLSVWEVERDGLRETLKPKIGLLRYTERTVGIGRFYKAKQENVEITMLVRIPRQNCVSTQDAVRLGDGRQFRIVQVQYPEDIVPPCCDLSLEMWVTDYDAE